MTGCWAKATPLCAELDGCVVMPRWSAVPTVIVMVPDVAAVRDPDVKLRVRFPVVPVILRLLNVARPLALVVAVIVPPSVPPPLAIAAVITTPDCDTRLFPPSRSWMAGCCAKATPFCAELDG